MAVAEVFLAAFLQVLFEKLASRLLQGFARQQGLRAQLKKCSKLLQGIQSVITDAEGKQITDTAVKLWLDSLRDVAYDLDDVLDELATEAQRQPDRPRRSKLTRLVSTCQNFSPRSIKFNSRIESEVECITAKLDEIVKRNDLNLSVRGAPGGMLSTTHRRNPTTSLVESHVYGRDKDKAEILNMLFKREGFEDNNAVCVVPIVGMGGVGKTTLAQLVYNDESVKSFFGLKAWVCVSEEFDVTTITKTIFESVTQSSGESKDLNQLQVTLQERLSKEKFLLVLDDMWNEDYQNWDLLRRPFQVGLPGSKVIVTTRHASVADLVHSRSVLPYSVKQLTNDDCLSLLAQHALGESNFDAHSGLKQAGEKLARKCGGLPLAAKALGGILRSKLSPSEWEGVLNSNMWDLPREAKILPVLRLSYYHLPSHLKQLFAYCSVFPKDYEFDKNELVYLWMGEGFLQQPPSGRRTMEEFGLECFNELESRSFFQGSSSIDSRYVMHDLINDLAQFVAGGTCHRLDDKVDIYELDKVSESTRHVSFLRHEYEVFKKFQALHKVQGLRTFIPMPVQNSHVWPPFYLSNKILLRFLPTLRRLRVLSLSGYSISELPSSICSLIHLRYFNLSGTAITSLPETIQNLYNLQTLSLRNCRYISMLPETLGDLVNLRHLDNANTDQLKEMPVGIGKLTSLQTLPKIVLGRSSGLRLSELKNLTHLRGAVSIVQLQNVADVHEAKEANLKDKTGLVELQMSWSNSNGGSRDEVLEFNVLEMLQPHRNLQTLKIDFFAGMKFPTWIGDPLFLLLGSISITNCANCTSLPPLGQLPKLKHLRIGDMPGVKRIGDEFLMNNYPQEHPFPCLETLRFEHMSEWEEWSCDTGNQYESHFSCLVQLTMFKCPKLTRISHLSLPHLHELDIQECSKVILDSFKHLNSLTYLKLESVTGLTCIPGEIMQYGEKLEALEICSCREILTLWEKGVSTKSLKRLRRLVVADCSNVVCLGDEDEVLPMNLEVLELFGCATLNSLPMELSRLMSLREIIVKYCHRLVSFPEIGVPPMLRRLEIQSCNALNSLPSGLSNLERLELKDCPSLRAWPGGRFPKTFKKIVIKNIEHLAPVSEEVFLHNSSMSVEELNVWNWESVGSLLDYMNYFSCLSELYISHCDTLDHFPEQGLPTPNLRILSIEYCSHLKATPWQIHRISSLVSLEIRSCPKLETFPKGDLPSGLTSLRVWDSRKLKPLAEWQLDRLTSLQELSICGGFPEQVSFDDDEHLFPSSITKLSIARFPRLRSLYRGLDRLTSLQHLSLMNCPTLHHLPGRDILDRLWHLKISNCKQLKHRCLKDKGDYWSMIADIPCVEVDD